MLARLSRSLPNQAAKVRSHACHEEGNGFDSRVRFKAVASSTCLRVPECDALPRARRGQRHGHGGRGPGARGGQRPGGCLPRDALRLPGDGAQRVHDVPLPASDGVLLPDMKFPLL